MIAELGYAQASIRRIADRVGVAMSVVPYHVKSKDELIAAVVEEMYRDAFAVVVNGVVADVIRDPGFDVRGYGEIVVDVFDRATRRLP